MSTKTDFMKKGGVEAFGSSEVKYVKPAKSLEAVLRSSERADKTKKFMDEGGVRGFGSFEMKDVDAAKGDQAATVVNMAIERLKAKKVKTQ